MLLLFSCPVMSNSLPHHRVQHARPLCPSLSPKVCPGSCPLHQWRHPAMSYSDTVFSFSPQTFQASGAFPMSQLFASNTKMLEFQLQHQSFQWVFSVDFPRDWMVWSPCCPRDAQEASPTPQLEGISSLVLCLLYNPAIIIIGGHWEDQSFGYTDLCQQSNISAFQHTI